MTLNLPYILHSTPQVNGASVALQEVVPCRSRNKCLHVKSAPTPETNLPTVDVTHPCW